MNLIGCLVLIISLLMYFHKSLFTNFSLVKKIRENDLSLEYFTQHDLGITVSKTIYAFYMKIGKLIDYAVFDETIEPNFVSFKLKKNNS